MAVPKWNLELVKRDIEGIKLLADGTINVEVRDEGTATYVRHGHLDITLSDIFPDIESDTDDNPQNYTDMQDAILQYIYDEGIVYDYELTEENFHDHDSEDITMNEINLYNSQGASVTPEEVDNMLEGA
jgi:hypothetical protein